MKPEDWIVIKDDIIPYKLNHFTIPHHYVNDVESILIPHGLILDRVEKLAHLILEDFLKDDNPKDEEFPGIVAICVLKGGHQFFADLLNVIKRINQSLPHSVPVSLEFFKISSYLNDKSTGEVSINLPSGETWEQMAQRFKNKNLLVIEDIVDSGRTMKAFTEKLNTMNAKSVKVASLFLKRTPLSNGYIPDYVGFEIPNHFIVGYCLDYNEHFRDLEHVCVISETGKKKYAVANK